jgi:RNA polymerase sigma-70 factor (ECF subfamily)
MMPASNPPDSDVLVERARHGDASARRALLTRHRDQLRRMVAIRMDRRLAARVDPSDVVQEVLAEAAGSLSDYLRERPLPFYPWLRQLASDRLVGLHRKHVGAARRSVMREEPGVRELPDDSVADLAGRLIDSASSPSKHLVREELRERVRAALNGLAPMDREVLVLRHLEQLSTEETAAVLGLSRSAVKMRLLRALERLRSLLQGPERGDGQ